MENIKRNLFRPDYCSEFYNKNTHIQIVEKYGKKGLKGALDALNDINHQDPVFFLGKKFKTIIKKTLKEKFMSNFR